MRQALFHGPFPPGKIFLTGFALAGILIRNLEHAFRGIRPAVQHEIEGTFPQFVGYFCIHRKLAGVDDTHVHPSFDGVVQKHGMHGFAHHVVAAEGETQVAHPAADFRMGTPRLDLPHGLNKFNAIAAVFLNPRANGENIRIKNYILGRETGLLRQNVVGPCTDVDPAFQCIGLPGLVKSHDDRCRAVLTHLPGLLHKCSLPLLQADGVHHAFALHAFQARLDHLPLGGVDHDRHPADVGLGGHQV